MKLCITLFLITLVPFLLFAQTDEERIEIAGKYNVKKLTELANQYKVQAAINKAEALNLAKQNNWPVRFDEDGSTSELMKVTKNGYPLYYTTYNVNASKSTRANTLNNGGILGLNLEGQNMTAHVWDAGLARSTHQEYDGIGGSNRFSIGDGTSTLHYHSAHVTGTIMASGYVASAKGMAPQAYAVGYDWDYDVSEATTAAAGGMLLSNHSYGWNIAYVEDWQFGAYASDSRDWDVVMYNAPNYLMVVAAGNEGNDNSSNGAPLEGNQYYDKLSGHSTTKNNMVVANGQDANIDANGNLISVTINSGSSEGPTDDYRIKPDITGNGTSLYSTYEGYDSEYASISGTSMASPNVCGTLLLLQQHYNNLNGNFMRAATLKGLALHTADDAGPAGPDVVYGWGLMNAKKAANTITNNGSESIVQELTLSQGNTYTIDVTSDGINDLVASISWTDPPGTANTGTINDNTPVLVNDLDIRITKGGSTYYPYKLTSITTNSTGDNLVDPFEKTEVASASGSYTITVSHKGSLSGGTQDFTLIVTGVDFAPKTWTGLVSSNWNTPGNWSESTVAGPNEPLIIPMGVPNWPEYSGDLEIGSDCGSITMEGASELTVTGDLAIQPGYSLTCEGNNLVKVGGDWTNNGSFEEGSGIVEFYGGAGGLIEGSPETESIFYDGFETNKGWVLTGEFQRASPQGLGGEYGNADPLAAYAGSNVLGVDLTGLGSAPGDYENYLSDRAYTATSPTINCSGFTNVKMNFQRWLGLEQSVYDHGYIDISTNNGASWTEIWSNGSTISDAAWNQYQMDISSWADNQSQVKIRFSIGSTDVAWRYCGWNIDEFEIVGTGSITTETFYNLTINSSGGEVATGGDITVVNDLTVKPEAFFSNQSGYQLDIGGDFFIESLNASTGSFINNGTTVVTGTTAVQKYYTDNRWHFISSPVSSAQSNIFLNIYLKEWNEDSFDWSYITALDFDLLPGVGYEIWSTLGNPTITYSGGDLMHSNYSPPLTATDVNGGGIGNEEGWNFVGNAFPSAIDLGNSANPYPGYSRSGLDNTVYFWTGSQYAIYNPVTNSSINGGNRYVPSMQGFFVKSGTLTPSLTIPASARVHSSQPSYKSINEYPFIRLQASGSGYSDEILITETPDAEPGFDPSYDGYKLWGIEEVPQLFIMAGENMLSIDALADVYPETVVPLGIRVANDGELTLNLAEYSIMDDVDIVLLEDLKTGNLVDLLNTPDYAFMALADDEDHRFNLRFSDDIVGIEDNLSGNVFIYAFRNQVHIRKPASLSGEIAIYDLAGQLLHLETISQGNEHEFLTLDVNQGYYLVKFVSPSRVIAEKVLLE